VGDVDIEYAIENSLNTVAVKVLDMVGNADSLSFLKSKLRISNLDESADIGAASLALGQSSRGISLCELTAAYSIFQEGVMSKPRSYFKVTDELGRIILDNSSEQESVISRENAAIMTKLLEGVVDNGTAKDRISLDDKISVAGKTGTTQNNCDRYFVGYTPELLAGVWFGYEYPKPLDDFGGNPSIYIWDDVMNKIYEKTSYGKASRFVVPDTVQRLTYQTPSGELSQLGEGACEIKEGWFAFKE
jgi:penicillin-binding protein 1A